MARRVRGRKPASIEAYGLVCHVESHCRSHATTPGMTRYDFSAAPRVAAAAVLAGSLFAGCSHPSSSASVADAVSPTVPVTVSPLRYTKIATPIELSGSLSAVESVTVGAMTGGRVWPFGFARVTSFMPATCWHRSIRPARSPRPRARAGASAAAASESASKSTIEAAEHRSRQREAQAGRLRARAALSETTAGRWRSCSRKAPSPRSSSTRRVRMSRRAGSGRAGASGPRWRAQNVWCGGCAVTRGSGYVNRSASGDCSRNCSAARRHLDRPVRRDCRQQVR